MRTVDTVSYFRPLRVGQGILKGVEQSADVMNRHTALECSFMAPGLGPLGHPDMGPYVDEVSGGHSLQVVGYQKPGIDHSIPKKTP